MLRFDEQAFSNSIPGPIFDEVLLPRQRYEDLEQIEEQKARDEQAEIEYRALERDICELFRSVLDKTLAGQIEEMATTLSDSTREAYVRDCKHFKEWCEGGGLRSLPAATEMVASYLLEQHKAGRSVGTLRRILQAIKWSHRVSNLADPTDDVYVRAVIAFAGNQKQET